MRYVSSAIINWYNTSPISAIIIQSDCSMDDESGTSPGFDLAAPAPRTSKPLPTSRLKMSHLRMIVALEEHEMVSAAAGAMNISQPAASRMIAEMETLLDAQLCERLSRGVRLTPLGHSLARHARS